MQPIGSDVFDHVAERILKTQKLYKMGEKQMIFTISEELRRAYARGREEVQTAIKDALGIHNDINDAVVTAVDEVKTEIRTESQNSAG